MKKTLYIPTTTLNFNNILSSESVSPKSFYLERDFGYSRWFTVDENQLANVITLYEDKISFQRDSSELEDHPLLIEVTLDIDNFFNPIDRVFLCDHTIYLNPWNTRFIFFSEKDKITTLSLSDSSMETKMLRLYRNRLVVENPANFSIAALNPKQYDLSLNVEAIKKDIVINKLKGLLYGYYIGAILSINKKDLDAINNLKEMRSILSAINSSVDKQPSPIQKSKLEILVSERNKTLPIIQELKGVIESEDLLCQVTNILVRCGKLPEMWTVEHILLDVQNSYCENSNQKIDWISLEIANQESQSRQKTVQLSPLDSEIVCVDYMLQNINANVCTRRDLFKAWVNEVLIDKMYDKNISTFRKELADAITYKAKDVLGEQWQDCYERVFLNKLRKHLGGEPFEEAWSQDILSAIAAVILSGDDWDKMLNFLQVKGLNDYRLAFALYGELVGFANLVRDFTDILLNQDGKYLAQVYKEFHGQLHNETINVSVASVEESKSKLVPNHESTSQIRLEDLVRKFVATKKGMRENAKKSLEIALQKNDSNQDFIIFLTQLKKYSGWKTQNNGPAKIWYDLQSYLVPDYDKITGLSIDKQVKTKKQKNEEADLFSSETYKDNKFGQYTLFIDDTSWWSLTANLINEEKAKKQYLEDVKWFVENHKDFYIDKKKVKQPGRYWGEKRDNFSTINRFQRYLQNKKTSDIQWLKELYVHIDIVRIIDYLEKKYAK